MHVAHFLWCFSCRSKCNLFLRTEKKLFEGNFGAAYGKHNVFYGMLYSSFWFQTFANKKKKTKSTNPMRVEHLSDGRNESLRIKVYEVSRHWMWLRMVVTNDFHYNTSRNSDRQVKGKINETKNISYRHYCSARTNIYGCTFRSAHSDAHVESFCSC